MIERLLRGEHLSEAEAADLMTTLTDPDVHDAVKAGLLIALRAKGETPDEVRGMARAMRAAARPLAVDDVVDTCGTGGDHKGTVNLSTAAGLVVAACGHRVAKHGNRSVSSRSGSADVLEVLGVDLAADPEEGLRERNFAFLFAPVFHPAMKAVVPVRRAMGVRTVFNVLGPLTNPAKPAHQLIGAFSEEAAELMAHALVGLVESAYVVHGEGGYDEAVPVGPFVRFHVTDRVEREVVDPRAYGVQRCEPADLVGGDAGQNAMILAAAFAGDPGPVRDAILLNAALVLELLGEDDPMARAEAAIDSGDVRRLVAALGGRHG